MKALLLTAVLAVFLNFGSAQNESAQNFLLDICTKNFDYHPHPTECDKFIQCRYTNGNILIGEIQPCSFPSYWNQSILTCVKVNEMVCETDMCEKEIDNTTFPGEKNCRGYWECQNGKSVPLCCPAGQKYVNSTVGCMDNEIMHECNQTCMDDVYMFAMFENKTALFENETTAENETAMENEKIIELCDKDVVPGQPTMYELRVPGFLFPIPMMCAPGTVFNYSTCNCTVPSVQLIMAPMKKECKPEVFLTVDNTSIRMTGKTKHITNTDVLIEDGKAIFYGNGSRLTIPRFNNVEHLDTVIIKVNYTSEHTKPVVAPIVSNSGENCNFPSILLYEDPSNIYFGASTTTSTRTGTFTSINLEQEATTMPGQMTRKSVVYKLKDQVLYGQLGNNMTEKSAPGNLINVHCPLHVGYAKDMVNFEGELESLEIYLCDPDEI